MDCSVGVTVTDGHDLPDHQRGRRADVRPRREGRELGERARDHPLVLGPRPLHDRGRGRDRPARVDQRRAGLGELPGGHQHDQGVGGGTVGIVAGVNFAMSDMILAGLEFQGGVMWPDSDWDWEAYALGRVGVTVSDGIMAYGAAGLGRASGAGVYAFGGGVEVAAFDPISVRGEILGVGEWGEGPSAAKATAGVLFHFN